MYGFCPKPNQYMENIIDAQKKDGAIYRTFPSYLNKFGAGNQKISPIIYHTFMFIYVDECSGRRKYNIKTFSSTLKEV